MKGLAHVDLDVLHIIMNDLKQRRDVLATMKTCRFLYQSCMHRMLNFPISLEKEAHYRSFALLFTESQITARAGDLRELYLDLRKNPNADLNKFLGLPLEVVSEPEDHPAWVLVEVLRNAHRLQAFQMWCSAEFNPFASAAISALGQNTQLRRLSATLHSSAMAEKVRHMAAPLEYVSVEYDEDYEEGGPWRDVAWVFEPFRLTLQQMEVFSSDFTRRNIQFPNVTKLKLGGSCQPQTNSLGPVVDAFPNLRHLHVDFDLRDEDALRERRLELENLIAVTRDRSAGDSSHWRALDHVTGDVDSVYVCALGCHVRHLELVEKTLADIQFIPAILEDTHPDRISWISNSGFCDKITLGFALQMTAPLVFKLSYRYHHMIRSDNRDMDLGDIMVDMLPDQARSLDSLEELVLRLKLSSEEVALAADIKLAPQDVDRATSRALSTVSTVNLRAVSVDILHVGHYSYLVETDEQGEKKLLRVEE